MFEVRKIACSCLLLLLPLTARSAAPSVSFVYPAGALRGSTNTITLGGADKSWPLQAWTDHPGLSFSPLEKPGQMSATANPQASLGPHLIFFQNSNGVSSPKIFLVGSLPETEETEPNDAFRQSQSLSHLPVTVNGKLNKGDDVDSFSVTLQKGQWIVASVEAYSLDSPMDALLHLRDHSGAVLAFNHDRKNLDPFLACQAPADGTYVVQLAAFAYPPQANVRFTGGDNCIYRLTLTTGPYVSHTIPLTVQAGTNTAIQAHGWNLGPDHARSAALILDNPGLSPDGMALPGLPSDNTWPLPVTSHPQIMEGEPNNSFTNAPLIAWPCGIHGAIDQAGDVDHYRFAAAKNDILTFTLRSASLGFPLDAVLQILDASGKSIARSDDTDKQPDPKLAWTAPSDGVFAVQVADLYRLGGPDHVYQLDVLPAQPDFEFVTRESSLVLQAGQTSEFKASVERLNGHTNPVRIVAENLPPGVTLEAGDIPAKTGEVTLKLTASPEAIPSQLRISLYAESVEPAQGSDNPSRHPARIRLKGQYAETGDLLINETLHFWLTLQAPATSKAK